MQRRGIIHLCGVDTRNLTAINRKLLSTCTAVAVSGRLQAEANHLKEYFKSTAIIPIAPLKECFARLNECLDDGDCAVMASGDPMFFGIGKRLAERFGQESIRVYPAVSSVQHLFAHFKVNWDDAAFRSLHGRPIDNATGLLLSSRKTLILTDGANRPDKICGTLLRYLGVERGTHIRVYVGENIGMSDEKFVSGSLQEISKMSFGPLSCMILDRSHQPAERTFRLGLHESQVVHSRGLITKSEVRAAVLHALSLEPKSVLWDIGAGSGSVSLEASRLQDDMIVYSFEKNSEQVRNIRDNIRKFNVYNISLVEGEAPACLKNIPAPNRVFIGGSGGNLGKIIRECSKRILPGGRVVVTAVLDATRRKAPKLLYEAGFSVETSTISVTRNVYPEVEPIRFNPITIITGHTND